MKLIYPPTIHWEGGLVFQRPQQLMKAFANAGHRSVFMEYGRYDGTVYFRDGVEICDCRTLLPKGRETTILWVTHPPYYRFVETFHADLLVFDYIDEAADEFAVWNNSDLTKAFETADVITVVSQRLREMVMKQFPSKSVILLPNAADYEHFCDAKSLPVPPDMAHIAQPVLGFMGSIASWIDTDLIYQIAKLQPDWSIVLIGTDYIGVGEIFANCPNVHFLGRKLYNELPKYVGQFTVGLVPFQVRDMTHSSSPIKMFEYLAAGVPVVSTPIREALECPHVATGATAKEFVEEIDCLLSRAVPAVKLKEFARKESWKARVKQMEEVLVQLAEEKEKQIGFKDNELLRLRQFPVTSPDYWDIRFLTDWENLRGRGQTAFFAEVILAHLPKRLKNEIKTNRYSLCDAGCALGDAVHILAKAFPDSSITGIDFSTEAIIKAKRLYPHYSFQIQDAFDLSETYDVIFSSNVLALYDDPFPVINRMLEKANRYLILLLPFQCDTVTPENRFIFTSNHFPREMGKFELVLAKEIDCSLTSQPYCSSKQVLVVYKRNQDKSFGDH